MTEEGNKIEKTDEEDKRKRLEEKKKKAAMLKRKRMQKKIKEKIEKSLDLDNPENKQRFQVKSWSGVASWKYKGSNTSDSCEICKEPLCSYCVECHANIPNFDPFRKMNSEEKEKTKKYCTIVFGKCKHQFHLHCIDIWLSMASVHSAKCPVCGTNWEAEKYDYLYEY
mmetsp:Transcript_10275/g.15026  ORF Transcript_10275/g.15026 Transcript_10275/m.15026 type:complete len:168 (-) Transcript_10275:40-543(-)